MKRRADFLDKLLRGGPSLELLGAFFLGLLVVGLLSDLAYDLLTAPVETLPVVWRPGIAILLLTGLAYLLYHLDRRTRAVRVEVDESRLAPAHAGLVWLFGPGPFEHLLFALDHHCKGGGGAHCWLVMQNTEPVQQAFNQFSQRLLEQNSTTQLHPAYIDELDVRASYEAVRSIFERESVEEGLHPEQVIADVTGGTKPLSAGMVLAALTAGGALEYVESERDPDGLPIPGTLRVVLVDTTFQSVERE